MAETVQSQNPRECKITQEFLRSALHYDPLTGVFTWKERSDRSAKWNGRRAGTIAGTVERRGYTVITLRIDEVDSHCYAHRLAFIYMTGDCPAFVDHEDRDKGNNRWVNLRPATKAQNSQNRTLRNGSTSGFKGVSWSKYAKKWGSYINVEGRKKHLGYFTSAQEAHEAHCTAALAQYGEFSCVKTELT
jgi:hypothetical protein